MVSCPLENGTVGEKMKKGVFPEDYAEVRMRGTGALLGLIAEKTGESKKQVLRRILERAEILQRRSVRERATKRSGVIPSSGAKVAAKSRS